MRAQIEDRGDLRKELIRRLRSHGMLINGQHLRLIRNTENAPSPAHSGQQTKELIRTASQARRCTMRWVPSQLERRVRIERRQESHKHRDQQP